jgi:hypothetical protein
MKSFKNILMVAAVFTAMPLFAQEEGGSDLPGVDVSMDFVSNYVWRGYDVHQSYFDQQGKSYSGTNVAPAFQPSITLNTPVDGLSVNLWGSFAMVGREDADADGRLQYMGGGDDIYLDSGVISATGVSPTAGTDLSTYINNQIAAGNYNLPGYYAEANGLKRVDELDITIDYSWESTIGSLSAGIVSFYWPNVVSGGGVAPTELYVAYSPKGLSDFAVSANYDLTSNGQYYNASYGHDFEFSENVSLSLGAAAGYGVMPSSGKQGMMDVTGNIGMTFGGFTVGLNVAHRPDLWMYDSGSSKWPEWISGDNGYDGNEADPAGAYGLTNELVNGYISSASVVTANYKPMQKLPKNLVWVNFGYSFSI